MVRWQTWQAQRFKIFKSARHFQIRIERTVECLVDWHKLTRHLSCHPVTFQYDQPNW